MIDDSSTEMYPEQQAVGVAEAWQEGYRQGVLDERTSDANIGIAGFGAKVEPARNNPYIAQQPAACPKCDGTGGADSGGIHPWGAPATIPCDCQQPAAVAQGVEEGVCDYGANPENRWPHHDECSIYAAPPSAPVEVEGISFRKARELLANAYSDAGCFSTADKLLRTGYVSNANEVVALRAIEMALAQQPAPSAPVGVEGLMQLARNWCLTWGEWAHDADPGGAKENAAETALRAALLAALAGKTEVE